MQRVSDDEQETTEKKDIIKCQSGFSLCIYNQIKINKKMQLAP